MNELVATDEITEKKQSCIQWTVDDFTVKFCQKVHFNPLVPDFIFQREK